MTVLVFDIETIPDLDFGRVALGLEGLSDVQITKAMFAHARQHGGGEFLPHDQHRIVVISCALRRGDSLKVWSLGDLDSDERELIVRFFEGIDRYTPTLVSWNGSGFDLPVLHYRALKYGVVGQRYWESGDGDQSFRFNNYLNRYHERHTDLMDVLSGYQPRAKASLSDMAHLLGLPGKLSFSGDKVGDAYAAGNLDGIRRYCETDVLNTWLLYLRYQLMRGRIDVAELAAEESKVRELLASCSELHFKEFLAAWPQLKK
ncbi:MAG: 3'-5' exonuclease [Gammaproteobacteria bacterium]|nr:3'-5' exonuclease [Gammaproteobacteria bacterium]